MGVRMSVDDFERWLHSAPKGSRAFYYRGDIPHDKERAKWKGKDGEIHQIAEAAWKAHEEHLVELVRKRLPEAPYGSPVFDYIAVRTRKPVERK